VHLGGARCGTGAGAHPSGHGIGSGETGLASSSAERCRGENVAREKTRIEFDDVAPRSLPGAVNTP